MMPKPLDTNFIKKVLYHQEILKVYLKELKKQNCPFPIGKISFLKEKRLLGSFQSIYYKNQLDLSFPYYIWTIKTKEEFLKIKKELGKTCLGVITDIPKTIYDAL